MENPNVEEQRNDDFLAALGESVVPENMNSSKEKSYEENPRAKQIKSERERIKNELKDKSQEETAKSKPRTKKKTTSETIQEKAASKKIDEELIKKEEKTEEEKNTLPTVPELPEPPENFISADEVENKIIEDEKKKAEKSKSKKTDVSVVSPEEAAAISSKKNNTKKIEKSVEVNDNFDKQIQDDELAKAQASADETNEEDDFITDENIDEIFSTIHNNYEDDSSKKDEVKVEVAKSDEESEQSSKNNESKSSKQVKTKAQYYGGDGSQSAFKLRTAKVAKILRNVKIDNPEDLETTDISKKSPAERQKFYLNTVMPTLQPSIAVVPLIISGLVITMTAFSWPDIREIVKIEEESEDLDPREMSPEAYIHAKNSIFIEKRRKQCDLFYKHIQSVSGYNNIKPDKETLFRDLIKYPDFNQLFFAAYAATCLKPHEFELVCGQCGTTTPKSVTSKELCFLLNKNIKIDRLNYFIENGNIIGEEETAKIYKEFQKERIVEMCNATYRTKKNLPNSSFIYELKIPTVYQALDRLAEINSVFANRDFSYTDPRTYRTTYIDSSFGLTKDLIELRKYLYLNQLIAAEIIDNNKETGVAKVGFSNFDEYSAIINSVYNLSPEDYNVLINDPNLVNISDATGIRHAIAGGKCSEETCGADIGNISVDPEELFFTTVPQ